MVAVKCRKKIIYIVNNGGRGFFFLRPCSGLYSVRGALGYYVIIRNLGSKGETMVGGANHDPAPAKQM